LTYLSRPFLYIQQIFPESFFLNKKALQQKPKGLELAGSPYWTLSELLRGIY
jgi:hypothetical protein